MMPAQASTPAAISLAAQQISAAKHASTTIRSPAAARVAATTVKAVRTTANLSLRSGPATTHRRLAVLKKGTMVVPTGRKSGKWWQLKAVGKTGWASSRYLKTTTTKATPKTTYRYITKYTGLQKSKSASAATLAGVQRRARVQYLGGSGAWRKVKFSTKTGYVPAASLATKQPAVSYRWTTKSTTGYASTQPNAKRTASFRKGAKVEWFRSFTAWSYVRSAAGAGWVKSSDLSTRSVTTPKPKSYRWATSTVNVRTGIGTKNRSRGTINAWTKVEYLGTQSGWSQVKTTRGTGWIKNTYLSAHDRYDVAVYGTLRHGQSAYFLIKGKTSSEKRTAVVGHNLYLRRDKTWWSYMVPGTGTGRVVVERMKFKPSQHTSTLKNMDSWERFDPKKPLDNQNYNRKLVTDASGAKVWAYVASKKMATYMRRSGIPVASGDYLKRY